MAKRYARIDKRMQDFIEAQHVFFVATAASEGRVNISPKDMDSLRVLGPRRILWRNLTGSGNETAGHLLQANRMTLMWCSFTLRPLILRVYGNARAVHPHDSDWSELGSHLRPAIGARQVFDLNVELVQTSCGYGVPFFDHVGPRTTLEKWATDRGPEGIRQFWEDHNQVTLDGEPTDIVSGS